MKTLNTIWAFLKKYALIILTVLCALLIWRVQSLQLSNAVLSAEIVADNTKFTTWVDSMGRENARQKIQTVYINQLDPTARKRLDEEAHNLGVKPERISDITQVKTETRGQFESAVDSNGHFASTDSFLTIAGKVDSGKVAGDYTYRDMATIVNYDTARKFLGITYRRDQYLNVRFENPKTKIVGLSNISLRSYERPKHWVVSAGAGYGLTPAGLNWNISLNVGYKLFEF